MSNNIVSEQTPGNLVYLPIDQLYPHPDNPRKDLGDLTELADSIKANGVFQNLTVVPRMVVGEITGEAWQNGYTVIIGHRRCAAAKLAGLEVVPCVIANMTEREQVSTMLLENMQRADLTVYEQAQGFQMMLDLGATVEEIAEKPGFSATTVRRRVKMMELDQKTLKEVSTRQLSLADFDKLAQIEDINERNKALTDIGTADFNRNVESKLRTQAIQKALPAVKKELKAAKAKSLKYNDTWSGKYDKIGNELNIREWNPETPLIPDKVKDKLFYHLDEDSGRLRFYTERKRAAPVKRSQEEIDKERRIKEAWAKADELNEVAYNLRRQFALEQSLNNKNVTLLLVGAVSACILNASMYYSLDKELIDKTLGVENAGGYISDRTAKLMAAFHGASAKAYPALIYAAFGDKKDLRYMTSYKGDRPKHAPNVQLDALYDWLCSLGYVMSSDEKALQDGTHELFKEVV